MPTLFREGAPVPPPLRLYRVSLCERLADEHFEYMSILLIINLDCLLE